MYLYKKWIHESVSPYHEAIHSRRGNTKKKRDSPFQNQKRKASELRSTIVELTANKEHVMSEISVISNDNSGGGSLGGSTYISSTQAGRQFGGCSEEIYVKKKWWCWCVWMIMTVLKKAFSNCYYYIYKYEQPRLRWLAPIETSNLRDVKHFTRIQYQGDSYSVRMELDSHTDTTVTSRNCTVIHYTERSCDVAPFSDTYEPMTNIPIITAATGFTYKTGRQ